MRRRRSLPLMLWLALVFVLPGLAVAQDQEVATPSAGGGGDWPTYRGGGARTGVAAGPGPVGSPAVLWQVRFEGGVASSPAVVDGVVFFGCDDGNVYALDAATGAERWRFAAGDAVGSSPAVADGVVYVGAENGVLHALDAETGAARWEFSPVQPNASPAVVDGIVYVGSGDGNFYALDAATGGERWSYAVGAAVTRSPAVADGMAVFGAEDERVHAVDAATGEARWTFQTEGGIISTPVIAGDTVYDAAFEGPANRLYALDAATGEERWHFATEGGESVWVPIVAGDWVYAGSDDGNIYALDAATGGEAWRFATGDRVNAAPTLAAGVVYALSHDRTLYAVDAEDGTPFWTLPIEGGADAGPAVAGGVAYFGTTFGVVYAVGGDGQPLASPAAPPEEAPVVASPTEVPAATTDVDVVWTSTGGPEPLGGSSDVAIDPDGNIWVSDATNHRFQIFAPDGRFLETWGEEGSGEGQFRFAEGDDKDILGAVAFDAQGSIYVADTYNDRIQVFTPDRVFLRQWGSEGDGEGQFRNPADLAIDAEGNVYVGEGNPDQGGGNRVQKFAPDGTFLLGWAGPEGRDDGLFIDGAFGVAVDGTGRVYVGDYGNNRLQVFDAEGRFLTAFGGPGRDFRLMQEPWYVAVDAAGLIYLTVWGDGHHIQIFTPDGVLGATWGERGPGPGQFEYPMGIAVGADGTAYVTEWPDGRGARLQAVRGAVPREDGGANAATPEP